MDELEQGRAFYEGRKWRDAHVSLVRADVSAPLEAGDLWLLAMSAYLIGNDDEFVATLDRAHRAHLDAGELMNAARYAFWLGFHLAERGEIGRATGWLGRSRRLLDRLQHDCVVHGYLLLPLVQQNLASGNLEASYEAGAQAAEIGERFGDRDLLALAIHAQGRARLRQARFEEGLALLDEAMIAVITDELSPLVTGLIYCSVIGACQESYALRRAHEWTAALTRWCDRQPDMVPYSGQCLVHRAEIMQLQGAWWDALEEARRARERCALGAERRAAAAAAYQQGEVHRLLGEFAAAEEAYRDAGQLGRQPQPGLALLRLAQGNTGPAVSAIRRLMGETSHRLRRVRVLQACIEIMLAAGEIVEAQRALGELEEIAQAYGTSVLAAMVAQAQGAIGLTEGEHAAALVALRRAWHFWQELQAPYEAACVRVLIGRACQALGDEDTAALELEAARLVFEQLGAAPDLARVDTLFRAAAASRAHVLTPRELQVLRLVAEGHSNKAIAAELSVSERTIDRHVSNIFDKLGVSSRSAATAYAYKHGLGV